MEPPAGLPGRVGKFADAEKMRRFCSSERAVPPRITEAGRTMPSQFQGKMRDERSGMRDAVPQAKHFVKQKHAKPVAGEDKNERPMTEQTSEAALAGLLVGVNLHRPANTAFLAMERIFLANGWRDGHSNSNVTLKHHKPVGR